MSKKSENKNNGKHLSAAMWAVLAAVAVLIISAVVITAVTSSSKNKPAKGDIITEISSYKGYTHVVSQEEYDFFYSLIKRDLYSQGTEDELDQKTRGYINKVNAKFYIGSKLGLCETFSYSNMMYRMEQENAMRAAEEHSSTGTVTDSGTIWDSNYGISEFTPSTYFNYIDSNLDTDISNYFSANPDTALIKNAKEYYDLNPARFETLVSISYDVIYEDGRVVNQTVDAGGMTNLQNGQPELAEFLYTAEIGDTMDYTDDEYTPCTVRLTEVLNITPSFEDAQYTVISSYINTEVIDSLLASVAANNPVKFEFDN